MGTDLTIVPDSDFNGSIVATVIVSDGEYTDSDTFTLIVNAVNDAPVLSDISDQVIDEDTSLIYTVVASDVDGDDVEYFAVAVGASATASMSDNILTVVPDLLIFLKF